MSLVAHACPSEFQFLHLGSISVQLVDFILIFSLILTSMCTSSVSVSVCVTDVSVLVNDCVGTG